MECKCKNCKFAKEHEEGLMCTNKLCFVSKDDACVDWDSEELFSVPKWAIYALCAIGIVLLLAKFL